MNFDDSKIKEIKDRKLKGLPPIPSTEDIVIASKDAKGGSELIYERVKERVPDDLWNYFQIILSRIRELEDKPKILWFQDTSKDQEVQFLKKKEERDKYERFVFPSDWSLEKFHLDLGVEYGALHHVDLDKALAELSRVLKKDAEMICIEALRHNPLIHWYRKRTPDLRTEWEVEHILGVESLEIMKRYFRKVEVKFFHLTSLILVPIRKTFLFPILLPFFDFLDRIILSTKFLGKYGWIMSIHLSDPIK